MDEIKLLLREVSNKEHSLFKMMAAVQGIEVDDIPDYSDQEDLPLPPEIVEMEERYNKEKEEKIKRGEAVDDWSGFSIGVATEGFDQIYARPPG